MQFIPKNKRILLEKVELDVKQTDSSLEEFASVFNKKPKSEKDNTVYRVKSCSTDCSIDWHPNSLVIVEGNMVEESKIGQELFITCKENFVIGVFSE